MAQTVTKRSDIPGWFSWTDERVFEHFLSHRAVQPFGDLAEIGPYLGRAAVVIGDYLRDDEVFTVCDLFGDTDTVDENTANEVLEAYPTLSREAFEQNYAAFHDRAPLVVEAPSAMIGQWMKPSSVRFIHVDGSHLYENVAADLRISRSLVKDGGIVALNAYRAAHTPGTASAFWEATLAGELRVVALTPQKAYLTADQDTAPHRAHLATWLREFGELNWEVVEIGKDFDEVIRIWPK